MLKVKYYFLIHVSRSMLLVLSSRKQFAKTFHQTAQVHLIIGLTESKNSSAIVISILYGGVERPNKKILPTDELLKLSNE